MARADLTSAQNAADGNGEADHLPGGRIPPIPLLSTKDRWVRLDEHPGWIVIYCYPMTGRPDEPPPPGWDDIPRARGCTAETCGFRDLFHQLRDLGAEVFGLSTQTTDYQREMVGRLGVPFEVLSDANLRLTEALQLPTFWLEGQIYLRRLTMLLADGRIEHVFYPIDHPAEHAEEVLAWLQETQQPRAAEAMPPKPPGQR
ncbi:MAG: peroxiredoxin [Acidimicrobiia bacterium]